MPLAERFHNESHCAVAGKLYNQAISVHSCIRPLFFLIQLCYFAFDNDGFNFAFFYFHFIYSICFAIHCLASVLCFLFMLFSAPAWKWHTKQYFVLHFHRFSAQLQDLFAQHFGFSMHFTNDSGLSEPPHYSRGSQPMARVPLVVREGLPRWYASNFHFFTKKKIHSFLVYVSGFVSE